MHPSPSIITNGRLAIRFLKALAAGEGDRLSAVGFVEASSWDSKAIIAAAIKSPISAGTSANAAALMKPINEDLTAYLMPLAVIGRLAGLRRIPLQTRLLQGTTPAVAFWSGEGAPTPLTRMDFTGETLAPLAVNALCVVTLDLLRMAGLAAETELGSALASAGVAAMDRAFLDPTNAGVSGVTPASVSSDLAPLVSSGSSVANIDSDLLLMTQVLAEHGSTLEYASWCMTSRTAVALSLKRGASGAPAYPGVTARGGVLCGLPIVVSDSMPTAGSPSTSSIVLVDAAQVRIGDDGASDVELSLSATLEMSDTPANSAATGTGTTQVSMFQTGCAAIRITRFVNWTCPAGAAAIALLNVNY